MARSHLAAGSVVAILIAIAAFSRGADPLPTTPGAPSAPDERGAPAAEALTVAPTTQPVTLVSVPAIAGDPHTPTLSALGDPGNDAFPPPLVDPSDVRPGGPPPDGIPPIDQPRFERATSVEWLHDAEPVLSLEINGDARAYPIQIMTWHEIVNDAVGDVPVAVTYCPLCNSAIVYDRRADGRIFDFGTSGRLLHSSLVMYDRQTESLWSHFTGQAVIGTATGTTLETWPVSTISWESFRAAHPDGLVLSRETGFARTYGANPYPGYDDVNSPPFLYDGEVDGRLAAQTRVIAVRGATETIAVVLDHARDHRVIEETLDGSPIVVFHQPGTASALDAATVADGRDVGATGVFEPVIDGQQVELEARTGDDGTVFVDRRTGTTFDILGRALDGPLAGRSLPTVEHLDTFWFAIAAFEPATRIVGP